MKKLIFLAASLCVILVSWKADAAGTVYKIGVECKFDIQQYCKDIKAKRIRDLRECLAKHEKDLLPRCQDHYKEAVP